MEKYLNHYLAVPGILWFALCSVIVTAVVHIILAVFSGKNKHRMFNYMEMYDELVYSATAMLFFIGLYFLVSYRYFEIPEHFYKIWDQYEDYILLAVLFGAIVIINIIDTLLVPLRTITGEQKASPSSSDAGDIRSIGLVRIWLRLSLEEEWGGAQSGNSSPFCDHSSERYTSHSAHSYKS